MTQKEKSQKYWVQYLKSKYCIEPSDIGHEPSDNIDIAEVERIAAKYDLDPIEEWTMGRATTFMKRFRIKFSEIL